MQEITLNLSPDEANGVLLALSKFSIEQAGPLYAKVQYQVAIQMQAAQAANQPAATVEPVAPTVTDTEGGSIE